jgi:hypothetical protein
LDKYLSPKTLALHQRQFLLEVEDGVRDLENRERRD